MKENKNVNIEIEEPKNFCDKYCEMFWSTMFIEKKTSQFILFKEENEWKIVVQSNVACCNEKILHEPVVVKMTKEEEPTHDNNFFCEILDGKIVIHDYENAPDSLIKKLEEALNTCVDKAKEMDYLREHCKYFLEIVAEGLIDVEQ